MMSLNRTRDTLFSVIDRSPFATILAVGHGKEWIYIQEIKNRAAYIDPCIGSPSRESRTPATVSTVGCFVAGCENPAWLGKVIGWQCAPEINGDRLVDARPWSESRLAHSWDSARSGWKGISVFLLAHPIPRFRLKICDFFSSHDDRIFFFVPTFILNRRVLMHQRYISLTY